MNDSIDTKPALTIYGDYFDQAMLKRMAREGLTSVHRAIRSCGHYAVRGYITPATEDTVFFYHLRRDGRVERSWSALPRAELMEVQTELTRG